MISRCRCLIRVARHVIPSLTYKFVKTLPNKPLGVACSSANQGQLQQHRESVVALQQERHGVSQTMRPLTQTLSSATLFTKTSKYGTINFKTPPFMVVVYSRALFGTVASYRVWGFGLLI